MNRLVDCGLCLTCKTPIWMEQSAYDTYRQTCASFHCVHGHKQYFTRGKSDAEKLQEQLDAERQRRQSAEQNIEYQRQMRKSAEHSAIAYKGQANQHPDFKANPDGDLLKDTTPVLSVVEGGRS